MPPLAALLKYEQLISSFNSTARLHNEETIFSILCKCNLIFSCSLDSRNEAVRFDRDTMNLAA